MTTRTRKAKSIGNSIVTSHAAAVEAALQSLSGRAVHASINEDGQRITSLSTPDPNPENRLFTGEGYYEMLKDPRNAAGVVHIKEAACSLFGKETTYEITHGNGKIGWAPTGFLVRHLVRRVSMDVGALSGGF